MATKNNKNAARENKDEKKPSVLKIDGVDFSLDDPSDAAKNALNSLRFADRKLAELKAEAALINTARTGYISVLKKELKEI